MNFDPSIMFSDVAIVIAALLGPILAVQAQKWLERRRDVKQRRITIFRTLMATRAAMLSTQHVEALNAVPVEFYGSSGKLRQINDAWKLYLDHHATNLPANDAWVQKRLDLFQDMLHRMLQFLGYNFSKAQLARDFYSPRAHGDLETEQTIIRRGLVGLFKGEISLPLAVKEFPTVEPTNFDLEAALKRIIGDAMQEDTPQILDVGKDKDSVD